MNHPKMKVKNNCLKKKNLPIVDALSLQQTHFENSVAKGDIVHNFQLYLIT